MIRRTPLQRRTPLRARKPMARGTTRMVRHTRLRARHHADGRVWGRPSLTSAGRSALRSLLLTRANNRCEACGRMPGHGFHLEMDHVQPRSRQGADSWANCALLCTGVGEVAPISCHRLKEAAYGSRHGRLLITILGGGRFRFQWVRGAKGAYTVETERIGGRAATDEEQVALRALEAAA